MNGNEISAKRGLAGENAVCDYLEGKGYEIVARNYRIRGGEIDVIAKNSEYIAIVEVKTRKLNPFSQGYEAMTFSKKKRIILTAERFLSENSFDLQPRFDVAYVTVSQEQTPRILDIEYYEGDFDATGVLI